MSSNQDAPKRDSRIIPLAQVPPDQQHLVRNCFYCRCPNHSRKVKAVRAIERIIPHNRSLFFGICANHAEVYPFTEEERARKPMLCLLCFPRQKESEQ